LRKRRLGGENETSAIRLFPAILKIKNQAFSALPGQQCHLLMSRGDRGKGWPKESTKLKKKSGHERRSIARTREIGQQLEAGPWGSPGGVIVSRPKRGTVGHRTTRGAAARGKGASSNGSRSGKRQPRVTTTGTCLDAKKITGGGGKLAVQEGGKRDGNSR